VDPHAFFPMHPLAHLMADGSLYHLGMSLYDREVLARLPLSDEHRLAHMPQSPTLVCWDDAWGVNSLRETYFEVYMLPVTSSGLGSCWQCYTRMSEPKNNRSR
jgi:hypothetical protein